MRIPPTPSDSLSRRRLLELGAAALGSSLLPAGLVRAQAAASITTTELASGLFLLQGAGCNVLALKGSDGALMVDGGLAANADALLRAVLAATGNDRVAMLVNTHWHPEQTGANEKVGAAGGTIVATEKSALYLGHRAQSPLFEGWLEPLAEAGRAKKTVRADDVLEFAGRRIDVGYLPAAHTDGDMFVHFADLNVMAVGGVASAEKWPLIDWRNGSWYGGRVRALERLANLVKPDTKVVPAEGKLLTGRDIARQRDIYSSLFSTMIGYMNMGFGPEDAVEHNPLKQYEAEFGDASEFLEGAYRSMLIAYVPD